MDLMHRLAEAAHTNDYFEAGPEEARELWAYVLRLLEGQASDREPRLRDLLQRWFDLAASDKHDSAALAELSGQTRFALAAIALNATTKGEPKALKRDAARYRWLRAGNAFAPEEAVVTGGDALDRLCDDGIADCRD